MADTKQFSRLTKITKGNTPSTDLKMTDIFAMQHIDLPSGANAYKQVSLAQSLCEPIAVTPNSTPSDGAYTAICSNYPDFSLTYTDASGNSHYLIGLKVRVVFTKGITYGSVSGGTYPTLNINGSGAIPLLAQGMTMAKGAAQNGQTIEFTIIPYGNGVAFDADSNVRESTSDYTIYTDGLQRVNTVANNNKGMVTSNAVFTELLKHEAISYSTDQESQLNENYGIRSWGYLRFEKIGKLVVVTANGLYTKNNVPSDVQVCSLPWLPKTGNQYFINAVQNQIQGQYLFLAQNQYLFGLGNVKNIPANTTLFIYGVYFTN